MVTIASIALLVCLFISHHESYRLREKMTLPDIWINRVLVQNGLAFFATWLSIATCLNFAIFLYRRASLTQDIASTIALVIILALIILYSVLENVIWQKYPIGF